MKNWLFAAAFFMTACAAAGPSPSEQVVVPIITKTLPDLGAAPELTNDTWLNVDAPLRLADLRGKVVAIDMWTFG